MKLPVRFVVKTLLFLVALLCFADTNQTAAQTVAYGTSASCTWTLTGNAPNITLTIAPTDSVTGAMDDYTIDGTLWYSSRTNITTLDIQSGVTHIGNYAFSIAAVSPAH
jgi:hypothetical protein